MQAFLFSKPERRVKQALHIKEDDRAHKIQMLKGNIKQNIPVRRCIVPAAKAQHPGRNIKDAEKKKKTQPLIRSCFIDEAFAPEQDGIYKSMHKKDEQYGAVKSEFEMHSVK